MKFGASCYYLKGYCLNFLTLTKTWHEDADSVTIRLRGMSLNFIEAARAIPCGT